jgi:hypothetical protein
MEHSVSVLLRCRSSASLRYFKDVSAGNLALFYLRDVSDGFGPG